MTAKKISSILLKNKNRLGEDFNVSRMFVFGSAARGDFKRGSDLDLLVEFSKPIGIFEFLALKDFLEKILKHPVDLVTRDAIRPWMMSDVERDSIRVA